MSPLLIFIIKRILQYVPMIFAVIIITFILVNLAPGDPTFILVGEVGDEEFVRAARARLGLDRPLHERFLIYISNVLKGDLGYSYLRSEPVAKLIVDRIPATLLLVLTAMFFSALIGIIIGTIAAARKGILDVSLSTLSILGISIPYFWLGQIILIIFSVWLGLFPLGGMVTVGRTYQGIEYVLDVIHHLFLPVMTLAIFNLAYTTKITRGSVLEALTQDYIVTARSKGLPEARVIFRHALRNALIPVVTYTGFNTGVLLVGAILTETVFAWPGMGSLLYDSIRLRDYPVILGIFIYGSIIIIIANLIVDLVYGILDPRIRVR
ncbi:MAG: ABC transporter permease [Nitrososphaeria archaeon]|nr:ABC transporter permease [Nitrososphaeria archaeon]MDW7986239.1 ABC transporter permease [Nitrososphaerota archaeon]